MSKQKVEMSNPALSIEEFFHDPTSILKAAADSVWGPPGDDLEFDPSVVITNGQSDEDKRLNREAANYRKELMQEHFFKGKEPRSYDEIRDALAFLSMGRFQGFPESAHDEIQGAATAFMWALGCDVIFDDTLQNSTTSPIAGLLAALRSQVADD